MKPCKVPGCSVLAPEDFDLCDAHRNRWLVSAERARRSRLRQIGASLASINGCLADFIWTAEREDRIDRERQLGATAPPSRVIPPKTGGIVA
jgi:hypothetical protein